LIILGIFRLKVDNVRITLENAQHIAILFENFKQTDKPEVTTSTSSPYQVVEGQTATMTCSVGAANPNTDITWRWVKTDSPSNVLHTGPTYTISNIQRAASGTYSCTASNSIGISTPVTVLVDVQCKY
jgi:hypothetical protein